jgi:hypothetical protein
MKRYFKQEDFFSNYQTIKNYIVVLHLNGLLSIYHGNQPIVNYEHTSFLNTNIKI